MDTLNNFEQAMGISNLIEEATSFFNFDLEGIFIISGILALGVFILYWLIFLIEYSRGKIKWKGLFIMSKHFRLPFKLAIAVYILSFGISMIFIMYNQLGI